MDALRVALQTAFKRHRAAVKSAGSGAKYAKGKRRRRSEKEEREELRRRYKTLDEEQVEWLMPAKGAEPAVVES